MGNIQSTDATTSNGTQDQLRLPQPQSVNQTVTTTPPSNYNVFPYLNAVGRLSDYEYFNNLLLGQHWEAFNIRINSKDYTKDYGKLRYVTVNFAGLVSKIMADMLFSEPITVKASEDGDQDWVDAFVQDNRLNEQLYESALSNSALGDALFKLRVDKRRPNDEYPTIILEDFTPTIFFPNVSGFNVRSEPNYMELAWTFMVGNLKYLRKEVHKPGTIEHHVYEMKDNTIQQEVELNILGEPGLTGVGMIQDTGIDHYMIIHIPNWKTGNRFFGISDYYDLDKLFYAINNRFSKIDNILDKHSDPILMVPDGVLDEDGKVNKSALHMIEVPEGQGAKIKPEYIVWNANLEAAFSEVDKLLNVFMMTAEITPDVLGMGQGLNDSGRALKFKLMRTIAKAQRKKLYYDRAIKEIIYVAELLAAKWDLGVGPQNLKLQGKPEYPEINWQDGLPIDDYEEVTNEIAKIDAGLQSKKEAIMNLDNIDEEAAEEKIEEINQENALAIPNAKMQPGEFGDDANTTGGGNPDNGAPQVATPQPKANDNANPKKPTPKTPQKRVK